VDPSDLCNKCRGKKTLEEPKTIEVEIMRGTTDGTKIRFAQEGDQAPGVTPGDILITIIEKVDKACPFVRKGADLHYKRQIELIEALTKVEFVLTHLDERPLLIRSEKNVIIKPGDVKVVGGEGMPLPSNPTLKGNLIIEFSINFPANNSLSSAQRDLLETVLPTRPKLPDTLPMDIEDVVAEEFDPVKHEVAQAHNSRSAYDEDTPEGGGQTRTCVHQ